MASKKGKKAEEQEEQLIERITEKINASLDSKLERFFQAAQSTQKQTTIPSPNVIRTRKRAREAEETVSVPAPQPQTAKAKKKDQPANSQSTSARNNQPAPPMTRQPLATPRRQPEAALGAPEVPRDPEVTCFVDDAEGRNLGQTKMAAPMNVNNPWAAWSVYQSQSAPRYGYDAPLPTAMNNPLYDEHVDSQVQQLLASSVHNMAKGNVHSGVFPFKHVLRGPEKRQAQINTVTLSEHLWGMFRIIHDPKVDSTIKPE